MHPESYNCVLCLDDNEETPEQLFPDCDFPKNYVFRLLNLQYPNNCIVLAALETIIWDQLQTLFFMNVVILMA